MALAVISRRAERGRCDKWARMVYASGQVAEDMLRGSGEASIEEEAVRVKAAERRWARVVGVRGQGCGEVWFEGDRERCVVVCFERWEVNSEWSCLLARWRGVGGREWGGEVVVWLAQAQVCGFRRVRRRHGCGAWRTGAGYTGSTRRWS